MVKFIKGNYHIYLRKMTFVIHEFNKKTGEIKVVGIVDGVIYGKKDSKGKDLGRKGLAEILGPKFKPKDYGPKQGEYPPICAPRPKSKTSDYDPTYEPQPKYPPLGEPAPKPDYGSTY